MDNGLATLTFLIPTDDEIENCEVVELTSSAQWDTGYLCGKNFVPGSDHYFYNHSNYNVNLTKVNDV